MLCRATLLAATLALSACQTPLPLEGDDQHVTVSLAGDAESVAAVHCRMFGKQEQFRSMDIVRQTAMFDCVARR
jgi:hypothetical protein